MEPNNEGEERANPGHFRFVRFSHTVCRTDTSMILLPSNDMDRQVEVMKTSSKWSHKPISQTKNIEKAAHTIVSTMVVGIVLDILLSLSPIVHKTPNTTRHHHHSL